MAELRGAVAAICEGRDGRLFLGAQDGFNLEAFTNGQPLPAGLLQRWRATLAQRGRLLAERGIPYIFFLVPDAPSVHPEDLPPAYQENFRAPGEMFLEAMGDIPGVTFVYPLQELRNAKGGMQVYKKKDSHWSSLGAFIAYQAFMRKAETLCPCRIMPARDVQYSFRRAYGDLGTRTDPEQPEDIPIPNIAGPQVHIGAALEGAGRQTATETKTEGLPPARALFFRDSFMTDLAPFIARSFAEIMTLGSTTRIMTDAIDSWHPTLVVSQVAERKLAYFEPDHQQDGFETTFHADFRSPAGARLLRATLLHPTDPAAARALIEAHLEDYKPDPMHVYYAALILEAAGDIAHASEMMNIALQARPDQPSFLALAARLSLAAGRLADAVAFSAGAAKRAPSNGYFHELLAYCLVQAQNIPSALAAANQGLLHVKDHPNLWYWASICNNALGQKQQALEGIEQALALAPNDPAYLNHHAKIQ